MITAKSASRSFFGAQSDGGKYIVRRTVAASVVGGTTSVIGGGKFANGAISGAMVHLFNHESRNFAKGLRARWSYSRNSRIVNVPDGMSIDEAKAWVRRDFSEFESFDTDNIATVSMDENIASFNLKGWKGDASDLINENQVRVAIYRSGNVQAGFTSFLVVYYGLDAIQRNLR